MTTKAELQRRITALEDENDELQDALDQIADLAAPPEDENGDQDNGDDQQGDDEDNEDDGSGED